MADDACPDNHPEGAQYGERCLPDVLDHIAAADPDRLYATLPKSTELTQGFKNITFREIAL